VPLNENYTENKINKIPE